MYKSNMANQLDPMDLKQIITLHTTIENARYDELMQHFEQENINIDSEHPGFTLKFHHKEYEQKYSNPYSYTQYLEYYRRKYAKIKGSINTKLYQLLKKG